MRPSLRWAAAVCSWWLAAGTAPGATAGREPQISAQAGLALLEAHLPRRLPAERADCVQLADAVAAAVQEKPAAAGIVVAMALSEPAKRQPRWLHRLPRDFPCGCVLRIVEAAVRAVPVESDKILEAAVLLFPGCADELGALLSNLETAFGGENSALANSNTGPPPNGQAANGMPAPQPPPVTADTNG